MREEAFNRQYSRDFLQVLKEWTDQVPESAWTPGAPPEAIDAVTYVAARTATGRVLVGSLYNFTKLRKRMESESRFGSIIGWVPFGLTGAPGGSVPMPAPCPGREAIGSVLLNIEERIVRLRKSQDRLNGNGSRGPAAACARAISELASLREELQAGKV